MKEKVKKLYFTNDFSVENVQKLQGDGWIIRNAQLAKSDSFVEQADEYGGDVPGRYKIGVGKITVQLSAETSPELQQTIDDAKAECEKVVAENEVLKKQVEDLQAELTASRAEFTQGEPTDLSGYIPLEQFDAVALDLDNTKEQLSTSQAELIAFKNDVAAMQARIDELQPPTKKPTAAELKAAKAAEEAAKVKQPKD